MHARTLPQATVVVVSAVDESHSRTPGHAGSEYRLPQEKCQPESALQSVLGQHIKQCSFIQDFDAKLFGLDQF